MIITYSNVFNILMIFNDSQSHRLQKINTKVEICTKYTLIKKKEKHLSKTLHSFSTILQNRI